MFFVNKFRHVCIYIRFSHKGGVKKTNIKKIQTVIIWGILITKILMTKVHVQPSSQTSWKQINCEKNEYKSTPFHQSNVCDPVLYICRRDNFRTDEKNSHSFLYKRLDVPFHLHLLWNVLFLSPLAKPAVLINGFFSFWIFTWRVLFIYSLRVLYIYRFFFYIHVLCYYIHFFFLSFKQQNKKYKLFYIRLYEKLENLSNLANWHRSNFIIRFCFVQIYIFSVYIGKKLKVFHIQHIYKYI